MKMKNATKMQSTPNHPVADYLQHIQWITHPLATFLLLLVSQPGTSHTTPAEPPSQTPAPVQLLQHPT